MYTAEGRSVEGSQTAAGDVIADPDMGDLEEVSADQLTYQLQGDAEQEVNLDDIDREENLPGNIGDVDDVAEDATAANRDVNVSENVEGMDSFITCEMGEHKVAYYKAMKLSARGLAVPQEVKEIGERILGGLVVTRFDLTRFLTHANIAIDEYNEREDAAIDEELRAERSHDAPANQQRRRVSSSSHSSSSSTRRATATLPPGALSANLPPQPRFSFSGATSDDPRQVGTLIITGCDNRSIEIAVNLPEVNCMQYGFGI